MGKWKPLVGRVVLLVVVLTICLLTLEAMLRMIYGRNGMHFGIEMWKYAKALKRSSAIHDLGHEHIPNSEAFLMGVPVKINSAGLRDREFSLDKPKDTYRILALGDSTTFGWGAHQDKTYPKLLEQKLNEKPPAGCPHHFEVINTGVGNYNTVQEVTYFKERGRLYKPDMVLIGFFINDAEETPREQRSWLARESSLYVFLGSAYDGLLRLTGGRPNYHDYYNGLYEKDKPGWVRCQQAFHQLIDVCHKEHIDLRFLLIPELHTLKPNYEFETVNDKIRAIAKGANVPVIDLLDGCSGQNAPSLWVSPADDHPNDLACELFAKQLYATLQSTIHCGQDKVTAGGEKDSVRTAPQSSSQ